jgi:hypothetical protein
MSQRLRHSRECANGAGLDRLENSRSTTFHANCTYASVVAEHGIVQAPCEVRPRSGGSCVGDAALPALFGVRNGWGAAPDRHQPATAVRPLSVPVALRVRAGRGPANVALHHPRPSPREASREDRTESRAADPALAAEHRAHKTVWGTARCSETWGANDPEWTAGECWSERRQIKGVNLKTRKSQLTLHLHGRPIGEGIKVAGFKASRRYDPG